MIKIELASYPKSGSSWLRYIVQNYLSKLAEDDFYLPVGIGSNEHKITNLKGQYIDAIDNQVIIYKSHKCNNQIMKPDFIIHIYRHPLDVFLSARNYLFKKSKNYRDDALKRLFINGEPKPVKDIVADNEMDHYFNEFLEQAGASYWEGMLGHDSNYFNYVKNAMKRENVVSIRYEDLLQNTSDVANAAFKFIWSDVPNISVNDEEINKEMSELRATQKWFAWQPTHKNYENFLSKQQIDSFVEKYKEELIALRYY